MRPSTFGRATWVFSDKAEVSCPAAKLFKSSSVAVQYFIRSSTLVNPSRGARHHYITHQADPKTRLNSQHRATKVGVATRLHERNHRNNDLTRLPAAGAMKSNNPCESRSNPRSNRANRTSG